MTGIKENVNTKVMGHLKITDKETGEILVDKMNAIHYGNLTAAIADALGGNNTGHFRYMGFGNNGTTIDSSGIIIYKQTNTSNVYDPTATMYNKTWEEDLTASHNSITITRTANYSEVTLNVVLRQEVPADQDDIDNGLSNPYESDANDGSGDYIFDEIALQCVFDSEVSEDDQTNRLLVTHVIFHPVQKSANRVIDIQYTIRIQSGAN